MKYRITIEVSNKEDISLELTDACCPNTVRKIIQSLPFETKANLWGDEVYTEPLPVDAPEENAKSEVKLFDVAYWPPGRALCLFFGPTPIDPERIIPYSPVNVIGVIKDPDKKALHSIKDRKMRVKRSE